jgi:hypothetical protein
MWTRLLLSLALGAALIACTPAGGSSPAATVQPPVAAPSDAAPSDAAPSDAAPSMSTESAAPSAS